MVMPTEHEGVTPPPTYEPSSVAPVNPIEGYEPERPYAVAGDSEFSRQFTAGQTLGPIDLSYKARTLIVDNPSGQWYFIPAAMQFVPPYSLSNVYRLRPTNQAHIVAQTPPAFTSTPLTGESTYVRWLDIDLPVAPIPFDGALALPAYESGRFYGPFGSFTTAAWGVNDAMRVSPFFVASPTTFDRIGLEVTGAGDVGSTIRLGVYNNNPGGFRPSTLLLDAGTIPGDAVAFSTITIAQMLPKGIYWLAGLVNGAPAVQPTTRAIGGGAANSYAMYAGNGGSFATNQMDRMNGLAAFPATYTIGAGSQSFAPLIALRKA